MELRKHITPKNNKAPFQAKSFKLFRSLFLITHTTSFSETCFFTNHQSNKTTVVQLCLFLIPLISWIFIKLTLQLELITFSFHWSSSYNFDINSLHVNSRQSIIIQDYLSCKYNNLPYMIHTRMIDITRFPHAKLAVLNCVNKQSIPTVRCDTQT